MLKFHTRFGPGEVTFPMKVEDWAIRRDDWLGRLVLTFVVPWLKEFRTNVKVKQAMRSINAQSESLVDLWESEDQIARKPVVTEIGDPENPFGFSEIRKKSEFIDNT